MKNWRENPSITWLAQKYPNPRKPPTKRNAKGAKSPPTSVYLFFHSSIPFSLSALIATVVLHLALAMVVLRSREIQPTQPIPKSLTPARMDQPPIQSFSPSPTISLDHDRLPSDSVSKSPSLRLALTLVSGSDCDQNGPSKRKRAASSSSEEQRIPDLNKQFDEDCGGVDGGSSGILGLRSRKRVVKEGFECSSGEVSITEGSESDQEMEVHVDGVEKMSNVVNPVDEKFKGKLHVDDNGNSSGRERSEREQTEKRDQETVVVEGHEGKQITDRSNGAESSRRYSRADKGNGKLVDGDSSNNIGDTTLLELESQLESLRAKLKGLVDSRNDTSKNDMQVNDSNSLRNETRKRFRDVARKNASRFAHFEPQEQQGNNSSPHVDVEIPAEEESEKVEDWPGPFSAAMKIIRDRENKLNSKQGPSTLRQVKSVPIKWIPRKSQGSILSRAYVPSLLDHCMNVLVKNVDAVASLDHVPDALRHRLCQLLCDCRGMKACFLELLLCGSPTEIRIKDCSWLTEDEFTKCFGACDISNLSVLQLDQCGRCVADYLLPDTLARSMPALITLSLCGACALTDTGLGLLLSAAPALRSINLSQCSLLTSVGINTLAQSLVSYLQELYIDDCQNLDVMLILPALKKLEHLEVLSVAGIPSVCDNFVREFVSACGHNMKEFVLANCTNLTDSAVKVIAETCPNLCALDLVNLSKLTDATLGYLANSCQKIQTLKFCRNAFSDEAIAAFVEISGEPLKELSLNNITKVGNNTALALARRSRNLVKLDLSWCRNLTDEGVGLIVDSCSSLRILKLFGCSRITNVFVDGHSNEMVEIIGLKLSPVLERIRMPHSEEFPLRYTSASSFAM